MKKLIRPLIYGGIAYFAFNAIPTTKSKADISHVMDFPKTIELTLYPFDHNKGKSEANTSHVHSDGSIDIIVYDKSFPPLKEKEIRKMDLWVRRGYRDNSIKRDHISLVPKKLIPTGYVVDKKKLWKQDRKRFDQNVMKMSNAYSRVS